MTATIIAPLPFTETNGETADATEVMANFNRIRDDVNNNVPLSSAIVLNDDPTTFYNGQGEFTTPAGGGNNFTLRVYPALGGSPETVYWLSPSAGEITQITAGILQSNDSNPDTLSFSINGVDITGGDITFSNNTNTFVTVSSTPSANNVVAFGDIVGITRTLASSHGIAPAIAFEVS